MNDMADDQILEKAISKEKRGYLQGYGLGRTVTDYYEVKPSCLDLTTQVLDIEQKVNKRIEDANKSL